MAKRNNHLAARVLLHYEINGSERKTAATFGISDSTVKLYKKALDEDEELTALFIDALERYRTRAWIEVANDTMSDMMRLIYEKANDLEPTAKNLTAIINATNTIADYVFTKEQFNLDALAANAQDLPESEETSGGISETPLTN